MSDSREYLSDNEIVNIGWNLGKPGQVVAAEYVARLLNNLKREQERNAELKRQADQLKKGPITHAEAEMVLDSLEATLQTLSEMRLKTSIRPLGEIIHAQAVDYRKLLTKIQNWDQGRKNAVFSKREKEVNER